MENADPFHDSLINTGDPFLADRECQHGYLSHENKCACQPTPQNIDPQPKDRGPKREA